MGRWGGIPLGLEKELLPPPTSTDGTSFGPGSYWATPRQDSV